MSRPSLRSPLRHARTAAPHAPLALVALVALLVGCQDLGPDQALVTLRYREAAPLGRERLVATVEDGARQYYVEGIDLTPGADGWLESRPLRAASDGDLMVRVALRGSGTQAVAVADVRIPLSPRAVWRVDVFASSLTPAQLCDGCAGLLRVPIPPAWRPSAQEWLYVTWTADERLSALGSPHRPGSRQLALGSRPEL
jgi:hypothetical protein